MKRKNNAKGTQMTVLAPDGTFGQTNTPKNPYSKALCHACFKCKSPAIRNVTKATSPFPVVMSDM